MEKTIKIISSPFSPNMESFDGGIIILSVPYSDKVVNIKINPSVESYAENADQPGVEVRQVMSNKDSVDTINLMFDFNKNNVHKVNIQNKEYEIKLMKIGKENVQGQDFSYFEFLIK